MVGSALLGWPEGGSGGWFGSGACNSLGNVQADEEVGNVLLGGLPGQAASPNHSLIGSLHAGVARSADGWMGRSAGEPHDDERSLSHFEGALEPSYLPEAHLDAALDALHATELVACRLGSGGFGPGRQQVVGGFG